jgi:hypothetical protein
MKKNIILLLLYFFPSHTITAQSDSSKFSFGIFASAAGNYFKYPDDYYSMQIKKQTLNSSQFAKTIDANIVASYKFLELNVGFPIGFRDSLFIKNLASESNKCYVRIGKNGIIGIECSLKLFFDKKERPLCPYFILGFNRLSFKYVYKETTDIYPNIVLTSHSLWRYFNDQVYAGFGVNCMLYKNLFLYLDADFSRNNHSFYNLENPPLTFSSDQHYYYYYYSYGIYIKAGFQFNFYKI